MRNAAHFLIRNLFNSTVASGHWLSLVPIVMLFACDLWAGFNPLVLSVQIGDDSGNDIVPKQSDVSVYTKFESGDMEGFTWELKVEYMDEDGNWMNYNDAMVLRKNDDVWQEYVWETDGVDIHKYRFLAKDDGNSDWVPSLDWVKVVPRLVSVTPKNGRDFIGVNVTDTRENYRVVLEPNDQSYIDELNWDLVDTSDRPDDEDGKWVEQCTVRMSPGQEVDCDITVTRGWILVHDGSGAFDDDPHPVEIPNIEEEWRTVWAVPSGYKIFIKTYEKREGSFQYAFDDGDILQNSIVSPGTALGVENANSSEHGVGVSVGVSFPTGPDVGVEYSYSRQSGTTASLNYTVEGNDEYQYWVKIYQATAKLTATYQKYKLEYERVETPPSDDALEYPPTDRFDWQRDGEEESWEDEDWTSVFILKVWKAPAESSLSPP